MYFVSSTPAVVNASAPKGVEHSFVALDTKYNK